MERIYLSPPYQSGKEEHFIKEILTSNWLAPVGKYLEKLEAEIAEKFQYDHVVAASSGTAALHLILHHIGVKSGDDVLVSDLTFIGSVNPILYQRGNPILIDSDRHSWNLSPDLLEDFLKHAVNRNKLPKALVLVHLYGIPADILQIKKLCEEYGVVLIEDVAEALGSTFNEEFLGSFGDYAFLSFNGNKIITTAGGGAVICESEDQAMHFHKIATQAKEQTPYYEHSEMGFNYRMNGIAAGLGLAQLVDFPERIEKKNGIYQYYKEKLSPYGFEFQQHPPESNCNHWLTCVLHDEMDPVSVTLDMDSKFNIECKPIWKPMHLQPLLKDCTAILNGTSAQLFNRGLCLPSGVGITTEQQDYVIESLVGLLGLDR